MKFKISTSARFYIPREDLHKLKADYDYVVSLDDDVDLSESKINEVTTVACIDLIGDEYTVFVNRYQLVAS